MIIGLTGSIGSGKSSVAEIAGRLGYSVIDCDEISHSINDDPEFVDGIVNAFGDDCIDIKDGKKSVNRKKVSDIAFVSKENVKILESISYPVILARVNDRINACQAMGVDCLIDAPTLFQSGLNECCDCTIGVISDDKIRLNRAVLRGGLSEREIIARMAIQPSNEYYKEKCDFIIENNSTLADLQSEVERVLSEAKRR